MVYDGPDPLSYPEDRESKRVTLQEIVAAHTGDPKLFTSPRVLEDVMTMVRVRTSLSF